MPMGGPSPAAIPRDVVQVMRRNALNIGANNPFQSLYIPPIRRWLLVDNTNTVGASFFHHISSNENYLINEWQPIPNLPPEIATQKLLVRAFCSTYFIVQFGAISVATYRVSLSDFTWTPITIPPNQTSVKWLIFDGPNFAGGDTLIFYIQSAAAATFRAAYSTNQGVNWADALLSTTGIGGYSGPATFCNNSRAGFGMLNGGIVRLGHLYLNPILGPTFPQHNVVAPWNGNGPSAGIALEDGRVILSSVGGLIRYSTDDGFNFSETYLWQGFGDNAAVRQIVHDERTGDIYLLTSQAAFVTNDFSEFKLTSQLGEFAMGASNSLTQPPLTNFADGKVFLPSNTGGNYPHPMIGKF